MEVFRKVFVVTGGGNGMGRQIVLNLLSKGASVVAADMDPKGLQATSILAEDAGYNSFLPVETNITDMKSVENLLQKSVEKFGHVDGVINNAGIIQPFLKFNDTDYKIIERIFNVNLFGTINMIKTFLPQLLAQEVGSLVNVSSMGGFLPIGGQAVYGASKAAVKSLSESLAEELKDTGVNVTTIIPGGLDTKIGAHSGIQNKNAEAAEQAEPAPQAAKKTKALSPVAAADMIVNAIIEDKKMVFVGIDSVQMNRLYRISPEKAAEVIHNKIKHHM